LERDRLYLIGFVIIVAVLTFLSALVLEPFGQARRPACSDKDAARRLA
jgi:hypothetical protein